MVAPDDSSGFSTSVELSGKSLPIFGEGSGKDLLNIQISCNFHKSIKRWIALVFHHVANFWF